MPNKKDTEEEIVYDDEFSDSESKTVEKLRKKLKKCVEEKQEYLDGWQRSKADFVNFKKRAEEDKKDFSKFIISDFVSDLLPALDSFDMAFKNKEAWEKAPETWRVGIEYIHQQLINALNSRNIKAINPVGEKFNPEIHHSVAEVDGNEGEIIEVTLKGYEIDGKTIRPPHVKVGKGN